MRSLGVLAVILFVVWTVNILAPTQAGELGDLATLAFGFILLTSFIAGRYAVMARLPALTGFVLAGILLGPHVLGKLVPGLVLLKGEVLDTLSIIDSVALGLIAVSAGGELRLESLRKRLRCIVATTAFQIPLIWIGVGGILMALDPLLPPEFKSTTRVQAAVAILLGIIAVARSPSTTIAIINEFKAKGDLTTTVLGVTVFLDVVVIVLFSLGMTAAKYLLSATPQAAWSFLPAILWEVFGSIGLGLLLGWLIRLYLKRVAAEFPLIILTFAFVAMEMGHQFNLSGLLLCMSAGFYVQNFSDHGPELINGIERYSLPVYVLFFTIIGARTDVTVLLSAWPLALVLVASRAILIFTGSYLAGRISGDGSTLCRHTWMGFVPQAGVSLGLATIMQINLPGFGSMLATVVVAVVVINQLIGPPLFRYALLRTGEASQSRSL